MYTLEHLLESKLLTYFDKKKKFYIYLGYKKFKILMLFIYLVHGHVLPGSKCFKSSREYIHVIPTDANEC